MLPTGSAAGGFSWPLIDASSESAVVYPEKRVISFFVERRQTLNCGQLLMPYFFSVAAFAGLPQSMSTTSMPAAVSLPRSLRSH
jgi:hypothetical protein